jgi:hypothetical protein
MSENRRKCERYKTSGLESNISDGKSAFLVVVEDISKTGVGVSEIPADFDDTVHKCLAVINAPLEDFKLDLNPKWVRSAGNGKYKKIGFQINNPSAEWVKFVEQIKGDPDGKTQRTDSRHGTLGLMAFISDGRSTHISIVEEISKNGLRLTKIPTEFDDSADEYKAVVQSPSGDKKVSLHPCWVKSTNKGMYKTVGFKIENPPSGWEDFIKELEKETGNLSFLLLEDDTDEE